MTDDIIRTRISIPFDYNTYFVHDFFARHDLLLGSLCRPFRKVLFILEEAVAEAQPDLEGKIGEAARRLNLPSLGVSVVQGGEALKDQSGLQELCRILSEKSPCRHSAVFIVGGGAFLDAVGLAAALFHRGIPQIRIPTTALAQCDSGVGVKNAINAFGQKNLLGTFAPPYAVVNDGDFLATLPLRERRNAMAEAVKVSMIKDADFFCWLERHACELGAGDLPPLETAIRRSAQRHLDHIGASGDPFERHNARPLDFGHWAAHQLEMMAHGQLRHGEAVATGLLIDTLYAERAGILKHPLFHRLAKLLRQLNIRFGTSPLQELHEDGTPAVMDGLRAFQEHLGGELILTFPTELGQKIDTADIDMGLLCQSVRAVAQRLNDWETEK